MYKDKIILKIKIDTDIEIIINRKKYKKMKKLQK